MIAAKMIFRSWGTTHKFGGQLPQTLFPAATCMSGGLLSGGLYCMPSCPETETRSYPVPWFMWLVPTTVKTVIEAGRRR